MTIKYLTTIEIKIIHKEQIEAFGGTLGIRDEFLLTSAALRPQSGYYGTIMEQAAALWESLSQNHAFIDGNKRVALDATLTFLEINSYNLNMSETNLTKEITNLYDTNSVNFKNLHNILKKNLTTND